ncbi:MAG: hypothetical protein HEP71_22565 [Roseivirga sp.]|nr:hypothetical protein [Roseivirga sp.]
MKKATHYTLILLFSIISGLEAQNGPNLTDHILNIDDLNDPAFVQLMKNKLTNSQFVFVGEQHGIKEAAVVTNSFYNLGQAFGYNTLCIETDELAADQVRSIAATGDFTSGFRKLYSEYPFTIPFYNNEDDHFLFENVHKKNGAIWGIDQTFITQFRLNLDLLAKGTGNRKFKKKLEELKALADAAYNEAIETKNFQAPYLFKYDKATHDELMELAISTDEKETVEQLWKTKVIYEHNSAKRYYQNNQVRGRLMKSNFMRYYRAAEKAGTFPKVVFKLGANHAAMGRTRTNIYDISSLGHELAISNDLRSIHVAVLGIKGEAATGNPFAPSPTMPFDNTNQLPEELKELVANSTKKYFVLNLEPLRDYGYGKRFSEDFKSSLFGYDLLILVNDAEAVRSF